MGGMGEKGEIMYQYIPINEVEPYRKKCSRQLNKLLPALRNKYGINAYFTLVGSGRRDMVTRNGDNGPFDLDYNLIIRSMPPKYERSPGKLKTDIRITLDPYMRSIGMSNGKDSTSAITYHDSDDFHFDLAIYRLSSDDKKEILKFDKQSNAYIWNELPNSNYINRKADAIRNAGFDELLRQRYLAKKNIYLSRQNNDHPSYNVYIEVVNEIYYIFCSHLGNSIRLTYSSGIQRSI